MKEKHQGWTEEAAAHLETAGREAVLEAKVTRRNLTNHDLDAENVLMVEALEVYADSKTYHLIGGHTPIYRDNGVKARAALKASKEGK